MSTISHSKKLFALALPNALTFLVRLMGSTIATLMVATLGAIPLAALGLSYPVYISFLLFMIGMAFSVSILVSHHVGAKDKNEAAHFAATGLWLIVLVAIPIILLFLNVKTFYTLAGQDKQLIVLAQRYFNGIVWGVIPLGLLMTMNQFILGISKPKILNLFALIGLLFNCTGYYTLIFGHFGAPKLGMAGVGYTFSISAWLMLIIETTYICLNRDYREYPIFKKLHQFDFTRLQRLFHIGWPIGLTMVIETISLVVVVMIIGYINHTAVASFQVVQQISLLAIMPPFATAQACTILVSHAFGAKNNAAIKSTIKTAVGLSLSTIIPFSLLFWLLPMPIIKLFMRAHHSYSDAMISLTVSMLALTAFFQLFDAYRIIITGALRGFKDVRIPMIISLFCFSFLGISAAYLNGVIFGWGVIGAWWGFGLAIIVCAGALRWRLHKLINAKSVV